MPDRDPLPAILDAIVIALDRNLLPVERLAVCIWKTCPPADFQRLIVSLELLHLARTGRPIDP